MLVSEHEGSDVRFDGALESDVTSHHGKPAGAVTPAS